MNGPFHGGWSGGRLAGRLPGRLPWRVLLLWLALAAGGALGLLAAQAGPAPAADPPGSATAGQTGQGGAGPGVVSVQLHGALLGPPVRLGPGLVLAATDDRRVQAVDLAGRVVWQHDFLRQVAGPPQVSPGGLVQVTLSSRQLALLGRDGRLVRSLSSPADQQLVLDNGRWLGLVTGGPEPELNLYQPDGRLLIRQPLARLDPAGPGLGLPEAWRQAGTWQLDWQDGQAWLSLALPAPEPRREWPVASDARLLPGRVLSRPDRPAAAAADLAWEPVTGGYRVRIQAGGHSLVHQGSGTLNYWFHDSREPALWAWGDSRWKIHLWQESAGTAPDGQARWPARVAGSTAGPVGQGGAVAGSHRTLLDFELDYLRDQEARRSPDGVPFFAAHVRSLLARGELAGRLAAYEDHLLELLELAARPGQTFGLRDRVLCLQTLALFPSWELAGRLAAGFLAETEPEVLLTYLDWFAALGADADGSLAALLLDKLDRLPRQVAALDQPAYKRLQLRACLKRLAGLARQLQGP